MSTAIQRSWRLDTYDLCRVDEVRALRFRACRLDENTRNQSVLICHVTGKRGTRVIINHNALGFRDEHSAEGRRPDDRKSVGFLQPHYQHQTGYAAEPLPTRTSAERSRQPIVHRGDPWYQFRQHIQAHVGRLRES